MAKFSMTKKEWFSFIIVIILQFIAMATANLLIPQYGSIIQYFGIDKSVIGFADSIFILSSAVMSIIWGYYTDRLDRNRVVMMGAFLWSIGTTLTAFDTFQDIRGFRMLLIARALTGAGMGSVIPIVLSIVGDLIPAEERSSWFGTMAILSSISSGAGQGMASFLAPLTDIGWRFPFLVISAISIVIIIMMFFVKIPERGSHEEELEALQDLEMDYMYQLTTKDIFSILKKKTNVIIFLQGFLAIIPGTLVVYFLTTLFSDPDIGLLNGLPPAVYNEYAIQVATIMAAFVGIGYLVGNSVLAGLGDSLFKKNKRNRVLLSAISLLLSVPLCILFVVFAPKITESFVVPENPNTLSIVIAIFTQYPRTIMYVIFAFVGSFFSAAPIANRGAVMVDVNLPEHRGTTNSFFNLSEQLGKGFTLALSYVMLTLFGTYSAMIIFAALFWFPAGIMWLYASKHVVRDMNEKSMILKERTQLSFLDYIFELEMIMDKAIQLIHDFAKNLEKDYDLASEKLNKAVKIFSSIEARAKKQVEMGDLENSAHLKLIKALMLKTDFKNLLKRDKDGKNVSSEIEQLQYKVDEQWERSDLGKVEILFDSGVLKVISARLNRRYDPFMTIKQLERSIKIFDRVIILAEERLLDEEAKRLSPDETDFQNRVKELIKKAQETKKNTQYLLERIEDIIEHLEKYGVPKQDLEKIIDLSAEYKVPYPEILIESLDKRKSRKTIEKTVKEIDDIFDAYDKMK
ncbi:MAG: MFS transporter [Candidatus Lokiarchaeota archaeon]|nr:MFS transporter [Candidatus Lokiarchaeota archaeon]